MPNLKLPVDAFHPIPQVPSHARKVTEREFTNDPIVPLEDHMTVPWALNDRVRRRPDAPLISRKASLGRSWRDISAAHFQAEVRQVAAGLVAQGLNAGDAVAIMSHSSYEWTLLDYACWEAGLVVVPVYETSSTEQAQWILTNSQVRLIVVENDVMAALVETLKNTVPELSQLQVLNIDAQAIAQLNSDGKSVPHSVLDERTAQLNASSLATVVYTSGTTGLPKGVELTHGGMVSIAMNTIAQLPDVLDGEEVRSLIFLPLAHVLARILEVLIPCTNAGVMGHAPNVRNLLNDLETFQPTFITAVPRIFEKIYNAADSRATGVKQRVFRQAAKTAIAYSRSLDTPAGPSAGLRAQRSAAERLVFARLREVLGGKVNCVISGGGPLGERLGHFYRGAGVTILEGYGLTETSAPATANVTTKVKIGTVGPPLPGVSVRVADDGEILLNGIGIFPGYHRNPEATAETFTEDGWLRTGDIGSLDEDGYLTITGRKKELIVTAGGKNVSPAILEDRLRGHPLVSQVLVVGDQRPCIGALITLDEEILPLWLKSHGIADMDPLEAAKDPQVHAALERAVARANQAVSRAESIRVFSVLPIDFTVSNGLLTPSMKMRRNEANQRFAQEIEDLYAGVPSQKTGGSSGQ